MTHSFRHEAMATWFEVRIAGEEEGYAAKAAQEVFLLIDHLESLLSRFRESSEISQIASLRCGESLRLASATFRCLVQALEISALTGGAFDPAIGRFTADSAHGGGRLVLHPDELAVTCLDGTVNLDLGAIGKGFALDEAAALLREWSISQALLVAGGSSILAIGPQEWEIGLTPKQSLWMKNLAIGASGAAVKGAHILDPRDGAPGHGYARTWASASRAAVADALSTAWMLMDRTEIVEVCTHSASAGAAILGSEDRPEAIETFGAFPICGPSREALIRSQ